MPRTFRTFFYYRNQANPAYKRWNNRYGLHDTWYFEFIARNPKAFITARNNLRRWRSKKRNPFSPEFMQVKTGGGTHIQGMFRLALKAGQMEALSRLMQILGTSQATIQVYPVTKFRTFY